MKILLILGFICLATLSHANVTEQNGEELLENLRPKNYSKEIRPNFGGKPVEVGITMFVIGISDISDRSMDFKLTMYLRHSWRDERLAFSPEKYGGLSELKIGQEKFSQKLWLPDTFIANVKSLKMHKNILSGEDSQFVRISPDGTVFMSKMMELTAACPMNLAYFPFDSQVCTIELESYGYSTTDIVYNFLKGNNSVGISQGAEMVNFKILGSRQRVVTESLSTGNYSRLVVQFDLQRASGSYIYRVYIPIFILVLASWVPLFLSSQTRSQHLGRVALSLGTLVAILILSAMFTKKLAHISFMTSLHCYLISGSLVALAVVAVCTVVAVISRAQSTYDLKNVDEECKCSRMLDKWARVVIPLVWLVYNVVYMIRI